MNNALRAIGVVLQVLGVIFIAEKIYFFSATGTFGGQSPFIDSPDSNSGRGISVELPSSGRGYPDKERQEFLKQVLASMGVEHTSAFYDGVYSVSWDRQDEETEKEIEARTDQFRFIRDVCPQLPLPKPDEPSREKLSCSSPAPDWYEPIDCEGEEELTCASTVGT